MATRKELEAAREFGAIYVQASNLRSVNELPVNASLPILDTNQIAAQAQPCFISISGIINSAKSAGMLNGGGGSSEIVIVPAGGSLPSTTDDGNLAAALSASGNAFLFVNPYPASGTQGWQPVVTETDLVKVAGSVPFVGGPTRSIDLQTQRDINLFFASEIVNIASGVTAASGLYATEEELVSASGGLQFQIDTVLSGLAMGGSGLFALQRDLVGTSGNLQLQIDSQDLQSITDAGAVTTNSITADSFIQPNDGISIWSADLAKEGSVIGGNGLAFFYYNRGGSEVPTDCIWINNVRGGIRMGTETSHLNNPQIELTNTGSGYFIGNVQSSGYFIGDGSKLTNVNSEEVTSSGITFTKAGDNIITVMSGANQGLNKIKIQTILGDDSSESVVFQNGNSYFKHRVNLPSTIGLEGNPKVPLGSNGFTQLYNGIASTPSRSDMLFQVGPISSGILGYNTLTIAAPSNRNGLVIDARAASNTQYHLLNPETQLFDSPFTGRGNVFVKGNNNFGAFNLCVVSGNQDDSTYGSENRYLYANSQGSMYVFPRTNLTATNTVVNYGRLASSTLQVTNATIQQTAAASGEEDGGVRVTQLAATVGHIVNFSNHLHVGGVLTATHPVSASGVATRDSVQQQIEAHQDTFDSLRATLATAVNRSEPSVTQFSGYADDGYGGDANKPDASDWTKKIKIHSIQPDFNSNNQFTRDRVLEIRNKNGSQLFYKAIVSQGVVVGNYYEMTVKKLLFAVGATSETGAGQLGEFNSTDIILI